MYTSADEYVDSVQVFYLIEPEFKPKINALGQMTEGVCIMLAPISY